MTGWLIAAAYVAVWLVYGWRLSVHLLDRGIRKYRRDLPMSSRGMSAAQIAQEIRSEWIIAGFGLAFSWPVVMPLRAVRRLGTGAVFRTPIEREERDKAELDRLRALARQHNLPMPGGES